MMKKYVNPSKSTWNDLLLRPQMSTQKLNQLVLDIIRDVKDDGDRALIDYAEKFDGAQLSELRVSKDELAQAIDHVSDDLKMAIKTAQRNIHTFHESQIQVEDEIETSTGVICWRRNVPIEKVGLYIPGGSAPLFSTILMLGIPARIAGCKDVILCTPPDENGQIAPVILYTAQLVGINKIYKCGGAQAIAAMAYGTETIPSVYKIFGPGNQYVTKAKEWVQNDGLSIDMPAGPSELLVIADEHCVPEFVAADLLSQAEHGPDSQVILLSNREEVVDRCMEYVLKQLNELPRKSIAEQALAHSKVIVLPNLEECLSLSNQYAPEHLIIATGNARQLSQGVINAGSVFLGNYSCESAGDYASGTNHTLPTNGFARNYSGVSLDSFYKKITYQECSSEGLQKLGPAIELMAMTEGLEGHKNAVTIRLKKLNNE